MTLEDLKVHIQEVYDEVSGLVENRFVFKRLRDLLQPNIAITYNIFFDHYVFNYVVSAATTIRRQVDEKASRGGLRMFLDDLKNNASLIPRSYYLAPFGANLHSEGNRIWNSTFGGMSELDPSTVVKDIDLLVSKTKKLKSLVDKNYAHKDKDGHLYTAQYKDLDDAIDTIESMVIKYYTLVKSPGSHIQSLLATNLEGWEAVFRSPWIKS